MLVDKLAKLNRSTRHTVSVSLIVIAALAMYNWLVTPHADYLSAAQGYESVMDNVVEKNKTISNIVNIKRKKLQELSEKSAQLQSILFTPDQAREFFSDLQAVSEETGCVVYSLNLMTNKPSPKDRDYSEDTSGIVTKSAVLGVVGVYRNIAKLMERLQAHTQKVWIDSVQVRTFDYSSDQPRCNITITICALTDKETAL